MGTVLEQLDFVENVRPVKTNIVIFDVKKPFKNSAAFLEVLTKHKIKASAFGPRTVRFVTHLDISKEMLDEVLYVLKEKMV